MAAAGSIRVMYDRKSGHRGAPGIPEELIVSSYYRYVTMSPQGAEGRPTLFSNIHTAQTSSVMLWTLVRTHETDNIFLLLTIFVHHPLVLFNFPL